MLALGVASILALLCIMFAPAKAYADDLKVYVGYSGGPYYLKHEYTDADLWALSSGVMYQYSFMDKGTGRLVKAYGTGPTLEAIFSNAYDSTTNTAVNPNQLWRFHMGTADNYIPDDSGIENGGYGFSSWWWQDLSQGTSGALGMVRYVYPDLGGTYTYYDEAGMLRTGENFNYEDSTLPTSRLSAIESTGYQVPAIIALRSSWIRITSAEQWDAETGPSSASECRTTSNRLLFGQSSPTEINGVASAHDVNSILCIYDGTPTVEVTTESGDSNFYGDIGETITVKATVTSADPLIDQQAVENINWSLTDDNGDDISEAYGLTYNQDGTISFTIAGDGNVNVGASYGNSTSGNFVSSGSMSGSGPHGDYDGSAGSGQGYGSGTGAGSAGNSGGGQSGGGSSAGGSTTAGTTTSGTQYEVQKIIDENASEMLQLDLDVSKIPWGGIILVLALIAGAALARIGAYAWDVDRRAYAGKGKRGRRA